MHVAAPGAECGIEIGTRKHLVGGVGVEGDVGGMLGGGLQELIRRGGRGHDTIVAVGAAPEAGIEGVEAKGVDEGALFREVDVARHESVA